MILHGLLALSLLTSVSPIQQQPPETIRAEESVRKTLRNYYWEVPHWAGTNYEDFGDIPAKEYGASHEDKGWDCSLDDGEMCDGGDWERGICGMQDFCHPDVDNLVEQVQQAALDHPESGYIMGQAVGMLVRLGRHLEALEVAESRSAERWWCSALRGHVFQAVGRPAEAEAGLRRPHVKLKRRWVTPCSGWQIPSTSSKATTGWSSTWIEA